MILSLDHNKLDCSKQYILYHHSMVYHWDSLCKFFYLYHILIQVDNLHIFSVSSQSI